ncbi:MAG: STT3 domain-containing protein, partial [Candidatus Micrarchaeia archaeon]
MEFDRIKTMLLKWWPVLALFLIFLFCYYIRAMNNMPDRILSFDPVFMYRQTYYIANWGHLPVWDELSYYPGRPMDYDYAAPFMFYLTTLLWWLLKGFGLSLLTTASYAGALYGAAITIPAFLLGRELSNKWGGLMAATLAGTAPQILIRTFGASYDTDQLVLFFLLLTIFAGLYAFRKKTPASFCLILGSFA